MHDQRWVQYRLFSSSKEEEESRWAQVSDIKFTQIAFIIPLVKTVAETHMGQIVHLGPQSPATDLFLCQREEDWKWPLISATAPISEKKKSKVYLNEIKQLLYFSSSRDPEFLGCQIFTMYETVIPNGIVCDSF